jgi:hypothetical protein
MINVFLIIVWGALAAFNPDKPELNTHERVCGETVICAVIRGNLADHGSIIITNQPHLLYRGEAGEGAWLRDFDDSGWEEQSQTWINNVQIMEEWGGQPE